MKINIDKVYFGDQDATQVDWRSRLADDVDDDDIFSPDEPDSPASPELIEMLGFNPDEDDEDSSFPPPPTSNIFK